MLYCVTDWYNYQLVEANSPLHAAQQLTKRHDIREIHSDELTQSSVTCAMSVRYEGYIEGVLESCSDDMARVLILNQYKHTHHFQIA